jgi:hypothetical protein
VADCGIHKDRTPLHENADSSIQSNFEFDSNVIEINDLHARKQCRQITSTDDGLCMRFKPLSENAYSSIRRSFDPD